MIFRKDPLRHQRRRHGNRQQLGDLEQLRRGVRQRRAVAGEDDRRGRARQQAGGGGDAGGIAGGPAEIRSPLHGHRLDGDLL